MLKGYFSQNQTNSLAAYGSRLSERLEKDGSDCASARENPDMLERLSDTELARLGLSHGVLALRAGGA